MLVLFQAVYPLLEKAKGKFVMVGSERGVIGQDHKPGEGAYGHTKVGGICTKKPRRNAHR